MMAHDEVLEQRIQAVLGDRPNLEAKRMFGGVGFMLQGNMACGVHDDYLIVRVGPDRYEEALKAPHVRVFDMTGRPIRGWVAVSAEGAESDNELSAWVQKGIDFALTLPPK
jgi:TfoX/Sxy family transcriptional regulator of competence genes